MAHDWIIGMLCDLVAYARKNGLDLTAEASEALLQVARAEIAASLARRDDGKAAPKADRPH